jgi:hypothetical protein
MMLEILLGLLALQGRQELMVPLVIQAHKAQQEIQETQARLVQQALQE